MFRVIAINKEINTLIHIEIIKCFCIRDGLLSGKSAHTKNIELYAIPVYTAHNFHSHYQRIGIKNQPQVPDIKFLRQSPLRNPSILSI